MNEQKNHPMMTDSTYWQLTIGLMTILFLLFFYQ
jgi:hypothetical protein